MQKNRMIIGAVALVAVSMVFAGVGYAAFTGDYTGTTSSSSDTSVNYVTVALGAGQYTVPLALYYDTSNSAGTITYTLKEGCETVYDVTITAVPNTTASASFTVATDPNPTVIPGGTLSFQYKLAGGNWTDYSGAVNVTLTSGSATLQVKVIATPGEAIVVPTGTAPAASQVAISFVATETVAAAP